MKHWLAAVAVAVLGVRATSAQCPGDSNGDGVTTVDEIVAVVEAALHGCAEQFPTSSPSMTPTSAPSVTATIRFTSTPTATPSRTPTLANECVGVTLHGNNFNFPEQGGSRCVAVDAGGCCWRTDRLHSEFSLRITTPAVQCGNGEVCISVDSCDCTACKRTYEIQIGNQILRASCFNRTPTPRRTPTSTPIVSLGNT